MMSLKQSNRFLKYHSQTATRLFLSVIFFLTVQSSFSQENEKTVPTLILLKPSNCIASKEILKEIDIVYSTSKLSREDSIQIIENKSYDPALASKENVDNLLTENFFSLFPKAMMTLLPLNLYETDSDFYAFPVGETSAGGNKELKEIAQKYNVKWVVNFPEIRLDKVKTVKRMEIRIQLYNSQNDKVELDKTYASKNNIKKACEEDSWECLTFNTALNSTNEIVELVKK